MTREDRVFAMAVLVPMLMIFAVPSLLRRVLWR